MDVCKEKIRLIEAYNKAATAYSEAVGKQFAKIGVVSRAEYQMLQDATEEGRYISADARDRLEQHIADHHC